jgi:O-antigen/teichoic acid export membrane protein
LTFLFTKNKLGPIGNSPLSHLPKTKRLTKEILVYALSLLSIPLIFICIMLAPQIIEIVSGEDYEGSVLPMKIVMI